MNRYVLIVKLRENKKEYVSLGMALSTMDRNMVSTQLSEGAGPIVQIFTFESDDQPDSISRTIRDTLFSDDEYLLMGAGPAESVGYTGLSAIGTKLTTRRTGEWRRPPRK